MRTLLADWWNICSALILSKYLWPITPLRLRCFRFRKGYESFSLLFREFATVEFRFWMLCDLVRSMHGMNVLYWLIDLCTTLTFSPNRCADWRNTSKTERTWKHTTFGSCFTCMGWMVDTARKTREKEWTRTSPSCFLAHRVFAVVLLRSMDSVMTTAETEVHKLSLQQRQESGNILEWDGNVAPMRRCDCRNLYNSSTLTQTHFRILSIFMFVVGCWLWGCTCCWLWGRVSFMCWHDRFEFLSHLSICHTHKHIPFVATLLCLSHMNSTWNKKLDCFLVSPWGWTSLFYYILFSLGWLSCLTMSYCVVLRSCGKSVQPKEKRTE